MLTLRPQLPEWRGRSRQVSHAALARQASEQRRHPTATRPTEQQHSIYTAPAPTSSLEKSELILTASPILDMATEKPIATPIPRKATTTTTTWPAFIAPPSSSSSSSSPSPPTSASMSPDYYDSPPSPPRSLEDQVHVAYALDDIHLAKVLLLKLKGIDVTSDDDPRIAAVKDEDFDFCFVPHGRLLDEEDERALKERQKKEMERAEEMRRADRLRALERIWEEEKRRLREAKVRALKRKEAEEKRRAEEERMRVAEEKRVRIEKEKAETLEAERRAKVARRAPHTRNVVTYTIVASSTSPHDIDPFLYDSMPTPPPQPQRPLSQSSSQVKSLPKSKSPFSRPLFDDSRTVAFSDVLASMQGPLFPPERRQNSVVSGSASRDRKRRRDAELLDSLLKVVEWEEDERRRRKGKYVEKQERPAFRAKDSHKSTMVMSCAACSDSSSSSSSPPISPTFPRRSWLSFSSASTSSASSTSTAPTTPSTSPAPWFTKSTSPARRRPKSWFVASPSPANATAPSTSPSFPCKTCSGSHRVLVSPLDSPLQLQHNDPIPPVTPSYTPGSHPSDSDVTGASPGGGLALMTRFWELARGLGSVYVGAARFSVEVAGGAYEVRGLRAWGEGEDKGEGEEGRRVHDAPRGVGKRLRLPGARVCKADVEVFLGCVAVSTHANANASTQRESSHPPSIPLRTRNASPSPSSCSLEEMDGQTQLTQAQIQMHRAHPPRTVLPNPLPYPIVFKPLPLPCRSPFRLHAHMCLERNDTQPPDVYNYDYMSPSYTSACSTSSSSYISTTAYTNHRTPPPPPVPVPVLRIRAVENPLYLRVKALQNVMRRRRGVGVGGEWPLLPDELGFSGWGMSGVLEKGGSGYGYGYGGVRRGGEGRGRERDVKGRDVMWRGREGREGRWREKEKEREREGMLGGGREKVLRVGWEGRGRSWLGVVDCGWDEDGGGDGDGDGCWGEGEGDGDGERDCEWW